jgi:hypothetical protein
MDEATLGAESRMSKRVPVTSTTGCTMADNKF